MGVTTGLQDIYYAKLIQDDINGVRYETPKRLAPAIAASVSPSVTSKTLYAENAPYIVASSTGEISVELEVVNIPFVVQVDLLGQRLSSDGVLIDSANDQAPEVALGFRRTTHAGTSRYTWLLKGRFQLAKEEGKTQGESIEFQTPTISGTFFKRIHDHHWRVRLDDGMSGVKPEVVANWFKQVYDPSQARFEQGVQVDESVGHTARNLQVTGQTRVGDGL